MRKIFTVMMAAAFLAGVLAPAALFAADAKKVTKVEFDIEGMHCGGCAARGEKALKGVKGVVSAKVTFEDKSAVVEYTDETNVKALIQALADVNLKATVKQPK